jgi:hypothetical protein
MNGEPRDSEISDRLSIIIEELLNIFNWNGE